MAHAGGETFTMRASLRWFSERMPGDFWPKYGSVRSAEWAVVRLKIGDSKNRAAVFSTVFDIVFVKVDSAAF